MRRLEGRGARALVAPAIEIVPAPAGPLDEALRGAMGGRFDWVVLTSRAGVEAVARRLDALGARFPELPARVAVVGEGTAAALEERGRSPDLVPRRYTTAGLARSMPRGDGRALLARADIAPDGLEAALGAKGWTVERVDAYGTRLADRLPPEAHRALLSNRVDAITFTSASTVRGFVRMAGSELRALTGAGSGDGGRGRRTRVVCIGPVTAEAASAAGFAVDAVASPHTIGGLVEALVRVLGPAE